MMRFMQIIAKSNFWPRPHSGAFRRDLRCRVNFSEELASPSGFVGCIAPAMRPPQLAKIARNAAAPALTFFVTQGLK